MKNAAVRALYRQQFSIPEETNITVECWLRGDAGYVFSVEWCDENDVTHKSNIVLPQIEVEKHMA